MLSPAAAGVLFSLFTGILAQTPAVVTTLIVSTATAAAAEPTTEPSFTSDQLFQNAVLNSTNVYRSDYNASAVQWNTSLASYATDYVGKCDFSHSGGAYGENLAEGYANATASIEAWGNEASQYDFSSGDFSESTGHFTQLVWKATTAVGCGRKFCNGQGGVPGWYVVCEYYPRGNVIGSFTANVQSCTNSTACGASTALSPTAWSNPGSSFFGAWGLWLVLSVGALMSL